MMTRAADPNRSKNVAMVANMVFLVLLMTAQSREIKRYLIEDSKLSLAL